MSENISSRPSGQESEVKRSASHSSAPASKSSVDSHISSSEKYIHRWSYENRLEYALSKGLSREKAEEWARMSYAGVQDSPLEMGIFKKTSSQKKDEENEALDMETLNKLLDEERYMKENSPSAEAQRRSDAGINDSLTAGKELGSGDASGIDDLSSSQSADLTSAINSEADDLPFKVASTMMSSLGGIMNMVNAGVDISRALYDLDTSRANTIFNTIDKISSLGNFFPFYGIDYDPEEDTWLDLENNNVLPVETVRALPKQEFIDRMSKKTGLTDRRLLNDLYTSYRGMMSPKAINSYMEQRKRNIDLTNETADSMAKGKVRFGGITVPSKHFGTPGMAIGSGFKLNGLTNLDQSVFTTFVNTVADMELYGMEAKSSTDRNIYSENNIKKRIYDSVSKTIQILRQSANNGSALANYLLVNMMSGTFNDIGRAAWMFQGSQDPKSFKDVPRFGKDILGTLFMEGKNLLGR